MGKFIILFFVLIQFLSCQSSEDVILERKEAPVGETFTNGLIDFIFESSDSIIFSYRDGSTKGKSAYTFVDGYVEIKSPHAVRPEPLDVLEAYILHFRGKFINFETIDASYYIVGKYERVQITGTTLIHKVK